jgi:hypothetical protein
MGMELVYVHEPGKMNYRHAYTFISLWFRIQGRCCFAFTKAIFVFINSILT